MAEVKRTQTAAPEAVCLALYTAMNATLQLYRDLLAPWGLSYQQVMVLGILAGRTSTTPGDIAHGLGLDSSSVAGLLRRMESAGLVTRETSASDRRRVHVHLTARSRAVISELGWLEQCMTEAIGLTSTEAHELVGQLHALTDRVTGFRRAAPDALQLSAAGR